MVMVMSRGVHRGYYLLLDALVPSYGLSVVVVVVVGGGGACWWCLSVALIVHCCGGIGSIQQYSLPVRQFFPLFAWRR